MSALSQERTELLSLGPMWDCGFQGCCFFSHAGDSLVSPGEKSRSKWNLTLVLLACKAVYWEMVTSSCLDMAVSERVPTECHMGSITHICTYHTGGSCSHWHITHLRGYLPIIEGLSKFCKFTGPQNLWARSCVKDYLT